MVRLVLVLLLIGWKTGATKRSNRNHVNTFDSHLTTALITRLWLLRQVNCLKIAFQFIPTNEKQNENQSHLVTGNCKEFWLVPRAVCSCCDRAAGVITLADIFFSTVISKLLYRYSNVRDSNKHGWSHHPISLPTLSVFIRETFSIRLSAVKQTKRIELMNIENTKEEEIPNQR